jgi:predicted RNase H-like HicB family nuclease
MRLTVDLILEEDGGWLAEVVELPGVVAYGETREQALEHVEALALRELAEEVEHHETSPARLASISFHVSAGA